MHEMKAKILTVLIVGAILQQCEPTGSALLHKSLVFLMFKRFLVAPLLMVGRRSVNNDHQRPAADEYLAMAASMDTDFCLPVAVCAAMARSTLPLPVSAIESNSRFDDLIVRAFRRKLNGGIGEGDAFTQSESPLNMYVEAARYGRDVGVAEACRQVSPTCKLTVEQLRLITMAVSDYNL